MNPIYFTSAAEFRHWLERHHATATELWVGLYKKSSGKSGITYREAVDEALCFGWIDGLLRSIDALSFMQRFTPRKLGSIWSNINVGHVGRLKAAGKMHPAGLAAFEARKPERTGIYSFESKVPAKLSAPFTREFRADQKAWKFFSAQPPGYRRLAIFKVMSPKQAATRQRWLDRLIAASAAGQRIDAIPSRPK